jgi:hypothetical protein
MNVSEELSSASSNKTTFFSHVFSTSEEGKAEIMNVVQYALLGVIPIVMLNKSIQRFIPDADVDKSSLELLVEILLQLIVMFVGVVLIHRMITYVPTYSEFKYEPLSLTNVLLAFMILVLSIQTKLGIKVNIMYDRIMEMWDGPPVENMKSNTRTSRPVAGSRHVPSQGDMMGSIQSDMFPPAPMATTKQPEGMDTMIRGSGMGGAIADPDPFLAPANTLLGSSF